MRWLEAVRLSGGGKQEDGQVVGGRKVGQVVRGRKTLQEVKMPGILKA